MIQQFVQQIINGLVMGSIYGLVALGVTMTFGLMGIVNFAHGTFVMAGAFFAFYLITLYKINFLLATFISMASIGIMGILVERYSFRFARQEPINGLIISIGIIYIMENGATILFGPENKIIPPLFSSTFDILGIVFATQRVFVLIISLLLISFFYLYIQKAKMGKAMRAVSENTYGALLMGIHIDWVICLAFAIGCVLATTAGIALGSLFFVTPHMGSRPLMKAFVIITLGGFGSIRGAFVSAFIIGLVDSLAAGYISLAWADIFGYIIFILILLFKPKGIFGEGKI
jgi:branched-chain amino acid transport system permease protein